MNGAAIQILMRYIHIVSAIMAVGGLSFMLLCLMPVVRVLDDGFSEAWIRLIRAKFHKVLWISIGGLVISGVYNWAMLGSTYKAMGPVGNALIGIKVLLALIMFGMVWVGQAGILRPKVCQMINIHLAAVVILLAAALRYFRLEHLQSLVGAG